MYRTAINLVICYGGLPETGAPLGARVLDPGLQQSPLAELPFSDRASEFL